MGSDAPASQRQSQRETISAREQRLCLALALLVALGAALPLLIGMGIVNTRAGGDSPFLIQRTQQLAENLRAGVWPAHWMPDAAHGLGYPFYVFYASLPYYLAAALHVGGWGVLWSIKLTQALGFVLAGLAMYALARRLGARPLAALLASAVYTCAPFHLVNVYVRGDALSEFYAMALFPLILWAATRLVERPQAGRVAVLAFSYGLLAVCHNISALVFSPLVALWLLVAALSQRGRPWRTLGAGGGSGAAWTGPERLVLGTGVARAVAGAVAGADHRLFPLCQPLFARQLGPGDAGAQLYH